MSVPDNANLNLQHFSLDAWVFPTSTDGEVDVILNKEAALTQVPIQYEIGLRDLIWSNEFRG